jgi:hypothetical protein
MVVGYKSCRSRQREFRAWKSRWKRRKPQRVNKSINVIEKSICHLTLLLSKSLGSIRSFYPSSSSLLSIWLFILFCWHICRVSPSSFLKIPSRPPALDKELKYFFVPPTQCQNQQNDWPDFFLKKTKKNCLIRLLKSLFVLFSFTSSTSVRNERESRGYKVHQ